MSEMSGSYVGRKVRTAVETNGKWLSQRAQAAEARLKSMPEEKLGPASKILVNYPYMSSTDTEHQPLQGVAGKGTKQPGPTQLPLIGVVTEDLMDSDTGWIIEWQWRSWVVGFTFGPEVWQLSLGPFVLGFLPNIWREDRWWRQEASDG